MRPGLKRLRAFVRHPATQLATGIILMISGGLEIWEDLRSTEEAFSWKVHHGVALFGLVQIMGSLPALFDGFDRAMAAAERKKESPDEP